MSIRIGFWKEYTTIDSDQSLGSENAIKYGEEKKQIIKYIKSGEMIMASLGVQSCVICDQRVIGTFSILTDGTWVWPEYYAHFIEVHNLAIPSGFRKTMEASKYEVPALSKRTKNKILKRLRDEQIRQQPRISSRWGLSKLMQLLKRTGKKA